MLSRKSFNAIAAACVMSLGVSSASAQTVANGPYYAMPSWDQTLPVATRFIVLSNMGSAAVLDRETGLVWERSPNTTARIWRNASYHCVDTSTGGRTGWRLPSVQEMLSLVDRSAGSPGPALPSGHPFSNVILAGYWSATSFDPGALVGTYAYGVSLFASAPVSQVHKLEIRYAWCVRGGSGAELQ